MKNILVLSDLHLRTAVRMCRQVLEGDCELAIGSVAQYVRDYRPEACIIAGDIFHQTRDSDEELKLFTKLVETLSFSMSPNNIFVIQGNHDRGINSIPELFGCTDMNQHESVDICGLRAIGKKYISVQDYIQFLSELDGSEYDIVVMHAPCKPFSNFGQTVLNSDEFPAGPLYIVGDTHVSTVHTTSEGVTVISPGCLFPGNIAELTAVDSSCGGFLLGVEGGKIVSGNRIIFNHRKLLTTDDYSYNPLDTQAIKPVLLLRGDEVVPAALSDRTDDFIVIRSAVNNTAAPSEVTVDLSMPIIDKVNAIVESTLAGDNDVQDVCGLVRDLVVTDDPAAVVADFVKSKTETPQDAVAELLASAEVEYKMGEG